VLRGALDPSIVHVIPNAVVASQFRPAEPIPPVPEISQFFLVQIDSTTARSHVVVSTRIPQSRLSASLDSSIEKESIF